MAVLISTVEGLTYSSYGGFDLHDPDCDSTDPNGNYGMGTVVTASEFQLSVQTAQGDVRVHSQVEIWDGPADPPSGAEWSVQADTDQEFPTGELCVSARVMGSPFDLMALPGGPGVFHVRVSARGRDEVQRRLKVLFHELEYLEAMSRAKDELEGAEGYLFQLWRVGDVSEGEEDDDDWL